ncbi:hypothetical protein CDD80_3347 [Ophiocordyceps camponoti-rufipedis]|uniref:Mid2 domain-containing protein n=1 Tax=Ophiocordyceps camponoti-rufipedis TaxID=2004952 RepID=A0A2C5ZGI7_9HYPO|nr:hypothetical protein CDD80_3347 [Ophiocordyceps camponoti-rufipedis]
MHITLVLLSASLAASSLLPMPLPQKTDSSQQLRTSHGPEPTSAPRALHDTDLKRRQAKGSICGWPSDNTKSPVACQENLICTSIDSYLGCYDPVSDDTIVATTCKAHFDPDYKSCPDFNLCCSDECFTYSYMTEGQILTGYDCSSQRGSDMLLSADPNLLSNAVIPTESPTSHQLTATLSSQQSTTTARPLGDQASHGSDIRAIVGGTRGAFYGLIVVAVANVFLYFSQLAATCVDYQASKAGQCFSHESFICCDATLRECQTYLTSKTGTTLTYLGCNSVGGTGTLLGYNPKSFTPAPETSTDSSKSSSTTRTQTADNQAERKTDSSADEGGGGTRIGAIVGGVVGGVAALALIALATVLLLRHRKRPVEEPRNSVLQDTSQDPAKYSRVKQRYDSQPVAEMS